MDCVWELANNHNQPIIRKFEAKLAKWKQRSLSMGGRITLINSVLSALPIYLLSMGGNMEAKKPIYYDVRKVNVSLLPFEMFLFKCVLNFLINFNLLFLLLLVHICIR